MPVITGAQDGSGTEAKSDRLGVPTGTADPSSPSAGDMYYKTDTGVFRIHNGTDWSDLGAQTITPAATYYDIGNEIRGWSYGSAGLVYGEGHQNNHSVNDFTSWNGITGMTDGGQFNRYAVLYSGTAKTVSGASVASGHPNGSDPLAARDVAFYYSLNTTNGSDGTWTVIEPKNMVVAHCKKHSAANAYTGNRTSTIDSNHVRLSGNYIKEGHDHWQGRNFSKVYNNGNNATGQTDAGNIFDVITWEPIENVKGIRMDIRSKWDNGHYSGEKPHVAEWKIFQGNVNGNTSQDTSVEMEGDPRCMCYVETANASGTSVPDISGEGYSFTTNSGGSSGTWTADSSNGGILTSSGATLRTSNNINRNSSDSFSYGGWFRLENNGGGLIWHGTTAANNHYYVRNNIGVNNGFNIGWDIDGNDCWQSPHVEDVRIDYYVSNYGHTVGTTWHFFVMRAHGSGLCETSIDGKPFEHQFVGAAPSSSTSAGFGIGGDPHNDNASSHAYGPFWFYGGLVPYWRVMQEWDRHKTRFGRS